MQDPIVPATAGNPIDAFILAARGGRAAAVAAGRPADADPPRVTYDLTGLPPTPEEVEAFVGDDRSRRVREARSTGCSPRRTTASTGAGTGSTWPATPTPRATSTPARSGSASTPAPIATGSSARSTRTCRTTGSCCCRLAADQAGAGDDRAALAAMGFLTLGRRFLGMTHDIIDDRIDVVTRGMMGLTVACARCHDHKYDPIPTADYYSLYGVFQSCTERLAADRRARRARRGIRGVREGAARSGRRSSTTAHGNGARGRRRDRVRARIGRLLWPRSSSCDKYPEESFDQILAKDDINPDLRAALAGATCERGQERDDPIFAAVARICRAAARRVRRAQSAT